MLEIINATMNTIMYAYVYTYPYVCLRINEKKISNDTRDEKKELGFFFIYYKVLALPVK